MTLLLRMKRPTTRRARTTWIRTATSLLACCLVLSGTKAKGQPPVPSPLPQFTDPYFAGSPYQAGAPVLQQAGGPAVAPGPDRVSTAVFMRKSGDLGGIVQTGQVIRRRERGEETFDF